MTTSRKRSPWLTCPTCLRLGRTCVVCAESKRRAKAIASGRACRRCESWRGMVKHGEFKGYCARCAAELRERMIARGIEGAPAALEAADRAAFREEMDAQAKRRAAR